MKPRIIQQGAEAIISLDNGNITKFRISKSYRLPILDEKLRKKRTKSEAKIIEKLNKIIPVPKIIKVDKTTIVMEHLDGKKLSENLETLNYKEICKKIGKNLTKLHDQDIVHGDLTTSNMIYVEKKINNANNPKKTSATSDKLKNNLNINKKINNFKVYLIDFGLGFHSHKVEDKAVDLHLLKQALEAKHFKIAKECFKITLNNYKAKNSDLIIKRMDMIDSRGRYKSKKILKK